MSGDFGRTAPGISTTPALPAFFEPRNYPCDKLYRQPMDGTAQSRADATFCPQTGESGTGTSFASYNCPTRYLRHYTLDVCTASNGGSDTGTAPRRGATT